MCVFDYFSCGQKKDFNKDFRWKGKKTTGYGPSNQKLRRIRLIFIIFVNHWKYNLKLEKKNQKSYIFLKKKKNAFFSRSAFFTLSIACSSHNEICSVCICHQYCFGSWSDIKLQKPVVKNEIRTHCLHTHSVMAR